MDYKLIYEVLRDDGFCGHNMADDKYPHGNCAWKNIRYEALNGDPECKLERCPFIDLLRAM